MTSDAVPVPDFSLDGRIAMVTGASRGIGRDLARSMAAAGATVAVTARSLDDAYGAGKGGVNQLTRVLALEWAAHGVTVNAVAPTFVRTPGTAERLDDPEFLAGVLSRIPAGRVGTTADVAGAVIYLASAAAA